MKQTRVAINGFGRIGRNALKIMLVRPDIEVVAINDLGETAALAQLFEYDSVYGQYENEVIAHGDLLKIGQAEIQFYHQADPTKLPWGKLEIDVVLECTGHFETKEKAQAHLTAGAKRVIISAPAKDDETKTFVIGVNEKDMIADEKIISNASCTTNCIAPVITVLDKVFGVKKAMMTTVHAMTASQNTLDAPARDLRMARAASINIIPTTTGASRAVAKVAPEFKDKFEGLSIRVPVPVVSLSDFVILLKQNVSVEEVNQALTEASQDPYYQGVLTVTDRELVSSDFIGNPASAIVDLKLTNVVDGDMLKVVAWYDNEWGYSNRLVELASDLGKKLRGKNG
ncbi:MAG: type I glyceraldehyde-3-phosphate dehydrogenase [Candidatus Saccharibacteria bacterium]|nr:type I glyceraldehyde-3-phosphate dehydrogenase [Candidatus Saccharibacteria bacterium]